jgi:TonB family protein
MKCLWPKRGATPAVALMVIVLVAGTTASVVYSSDRVAPTPPISSRDTNLGRVPAHSSQFAPVSAANILPTCAHSRLPEALLTPDPVIEDLSDDLSVRISFIIGADGRVHSAFILNSGGQNQDEQIMRAVRRWRYRPALCNGVPTPMEAQVSFVLR